MKLHLAANYDLRLVSELASTSVSSVYGKLQRDIVGGGRASYMGRSFSISDLSRYIKKLKGCGIDFTYLLNSSCLGNREWSRSGQKQIQKLLDRLLAAGVQAVTVSTPYLLKLIKERYPRLHTTVGIYAQVDTVERVKFWENLGADAITLESFSINRDFETLHKIRTSSEIELILIANHICLLNCPLQPYHQNCFSHSSDPDREFFIDYCYLECNRQKFASPEKFISSRWIRPEDLKVYEKLGYHNFKLLERDLPSAVLKKRVDAYEKGRFRGNLAELFFSHGFGREYSGLDWWDYLRLMFNAPLKSLLRAKDFMRSQGLLHRLKTPPVTIDSERIPANFLSEFQDRDCVNTDCEKCGYCARVAAEAVTVDNPEAAAEYGSLLQELENGEFWNV